MYKNIEIHETAFVTSTFRALNENLSGDVFAKLWNNKKTELWIEDFLAKVSSEEIVTHCLRNRYFLDKIKELIKKNNVEVLINFGAGFSMYPFLLEESIIHIEVDKPEIIQYKEAKIKTWQKLKLLPNRQLHFISEDFSEDYDKNLLSKINSIKKDKSSFILIEGVLFFLNREETNKLFSFFSLIQQKGDFIGSASFQESIKEIEAYKKLLNFFGKKVSKTKESDYQTVEDEFYENRDSYKLIDHQDYFSLSKKYGQKTVQNKEQILNENFYLLEKII